MNQNDHKLNPQVSFNQSNLKHASSFCSAFFLVSFGLRLSTCDLKTTVWNVHFGSEFLSGNIATSDPLSNANRPGLFVEGIGKIGLPLSDRDAAELRRASYEAPLGKDIVVEQ